MEHNEPLQGGVQPAQPPGQQQSQEEQSAQPIWYQAKPDYLLRKVAGEYLLVPVGASDQYENAILMLNETGSFLWELLADEVTVEELLAKAKEEFRDPDNVLEEQLREYIERLVEAGLVEERRKA